jgi:hypothetical protein
MRPAGQEFFSCSLDEQVGVAANSKFMCLPKVGPRRGPQAGAPKSRT